MNWPSLTDYQEAIQNPHICFSDYELKLGKPTLTKLGLPKPITGAFASVYEINCGSSKYAVRCFLRNFKDQEHRYGLISNYLNKVNLKYFIQFQFIPHGILIRGNWFPILKMEWIKGVSLIQYIENNLGNPNALKKLSDDFYEMANSLNKNNISHGDFQHGNIIIANTGIKLVDYDGMFVPGLEGLKSNEIGHPNYQHPRRTADFYGKFMDNFSTWIIYSSLVSVSIDPLLWNRLQGGEEHLLFMKSDFTDPINSLVFREFEASQNPILLEISKNIKNIINQNPMHILIPPKINIQIYGNASHLHAHPNSASWVKDYIKKPNHITKDSSDWIFSHKIVKFESSHIKGQAILIAGFGAMFLTGSSLYLGKISLFPLIFSILGLEFIGLSSYFYIHYKKLPEVKKETDLKYNLKEFKKTLQNLQKNLKSHQDNLKKLEAEKKSETEQLLKRKIELPNKESQEIQVVTQNLNTKLSSINSRKSNLGARERNEIESMLSNKQTQHFHANMRKNVFTKNSVPGIGVGLVNTLNSYGFSSAADINNRVLSVPGIGESRANALFAWKSKVEASIRRTQPQSLSNFELDSIKRKYEMEKISLDNEVKTIKNIYSQDVERIRAKYRQEPRIIENQIIDIQKKIDQKCIPINDSIFQTENSIQEVKKKINYSQNYLKKYSNVNIINYLKYLISPK